MNCHPHMTLDGEDIVQPRWRSIVFSHIGGQFGPQAQGPVRTPRDSQDPCAFILDRAVGRQTLDEREEQQVQLTRDRPEYSIS
jgi:hypothetical protein